MKITSKSKSFLLFFILLSTFSQVRVYAQLFPEAQTYSLLLNKFKSSDPGAVFLVAKEGKVIYRKAFGMADLQLNVPMNPEHVFEIGSMTKQFTAVSILMLVQEGLVSLDDEIIKFIPDYPTHGEKITIHHLLTHTSGIKNYTKMKSIRELIRNDYSPSELIDLFKNEPLDFNPGEKYEYSNSGYVILGYIIEIISDQSYQEFVNERIFKKLDMSSSYYEDHKNIVKNRASGYSEGYVNARFISPTLSYSSGSLMSTVDDMFKWQKALEHGDILKKETLDLAFTNYTLNSGEFIDYGYGWHVKKKDGLKIREHGGSIFGFKSMGIYLADQEIYVIGLSNCDCNSPTKITRKIAHLYLEN